MLPTLLLIDMQRGFADAAYWSGLADGTRNNPEAETHAARLLDGWRAHDAPVVHVQHLSTVPRSPLHPDAATSRFLERFEPRDNELHITKRVNNAFIGTDLDARLRVSGATGLVIAGLTTDHCVSTTTRMAGNLGFSVTLAGDACATFDRAAPDGARIEAYDVHRIHLASLHGEFATVRKTTEILASI